MKMKTLFTLILVPKLGKEGSLAQESKAHLSTLWDSQNLKPDRKIGGGGTDRIILPDFMNHSKL